MTPGLLLEALRRPERLSSLAPPEWNRLLSEARSTGVLARLGWRLGTLDLLDRIPSRAREQFAAACLEAAAHARAVRWEVGRIQRALERTGVPIVLLKGAAYLMANLPAAQGRVFSDVDIMVPKERLAQVEEALLAHGWETVKLDEYDQRYYRTWMHELPPLRHRERETIVDVHHAILPQTSRLRPDSRKLLASARPLAGDGLRVLAPADMVLHSAVHLFQDGEIQGGLQDLADLDALMRHFGMDPSFWGELGGRAGELGLGRPLFYALRFSSQLLGTPVPIDAIAAAGAGRPPSPLLAIMDYVVTRALLPPIASRREVVGDAARWLLFVRSHWLRMPPPLLARHLLHKSLARPSE
jgi:Uncharacterised nucleotidyltransferase